MKNKYKNYQHKAEILFIKCKYIARKKLKAYLLWQHSWKTTSAGVLVLFVAAFFGYNVLHSSALAIVLVPNGDVTSQWTSLGGTSDSTCTGGTHCDYVDENTTDNTSDYIGTGTSLGTGVTEEYDMATQTGIASASQVVLRVYAQSATNANGGTLDSISINTRINGTLQTATTCTPAYLTWGACTATFNGSWTQSDIDSLRVQIVRNTLGSGSPSNQDDDVRIANVYATLTYVPNLTITQSAYRWFNNQDTNSPVTFAFAAETGTTTGTENGRGNLITSDGGSVMVGSGPCGSSACSVVMRYSPTGTLMWNAVWGNANGFTTPVSVVENTDGSIVVAGTTGGFSGSKIFLLKYASDGTLIWTSLWTGSSEIMNGTSGLTKTSDGGYAVTGETTFFADSSAGDAFVVKFTSTGSIDWARTWGFVGGQEQGYGITETSDGGIVMVGTSNYFGGEADNTFAVKYTSDGTFLWSTMVRGLGDDYYYGITPTSDGGFVAVGGTGTYDGSNVPDALIAKYDSSGSITWAKTWAGSAREEFKSVIVTSDGSYVAAGLTYSYGAGGSDALLVKFSSLGVQTWAKTFGGTSGETAFYASQTPDGGYLASGTSSSYGAGSSDFMTLKYDGSGTITGCGSPMCQSAGGTVTARTLPSGAETASESSPAAGSTSPSATLSPATYVRTMTVAPTPVNIDVNSPLGGVLQDTAATAPAEGTPFRLRLNLHMSGSAVSANAGQYKLKFAPKGVAGSCSTVSAGSYTDVTDTSTIQYYDNPNALSGLGLATNANDPSHAGDVGVARQSYQEKGSSIFTNPNNIPISQDGMWDFALVAYHSLQNDHYCFKVVNGDGADLNSYSVYPELIIPPATFSQAAYRWYNPEPAGANQTFAQAYGTNVLDSGQDVEPTSDGGYIATGSTGSSILLTKYNSSGSITWNKTIDNQAGSASGYSVIENTNGGGYVVAGSITSGNDATQDAAIMALDFNGNLTWSWEWGETGYNEYANDVIETSDGGFAVTGTRISSGGQADMFIFTTDDTGAINWSKLWGGSSATDNGNNIIQTTDGGYIVAGKTASYGGGTFNAFVAKYTSTGTLSWSETWGGTGYDDEQSMTATADGGFAITGTTISFGGGGDYDMYIAKFDSSANLSWDQTWDGGLGYDEDGSSIVQTSDGGFAVTGRTNSVGGYGNNVLIVKYDSLGNIGWAHTWGSGASAGDEWGASIVQTSDGGYGVLGFTDGYGQGNKDVLFLKYDSSGNISGCTSPMCQAPSGSTGSPSATVTNPTAAEPASSATYFDAQAAFSNNSFTTTVIVATSAQVGNPLAPENSPLDLSVLTPLNLRVALAVDSSGIATNDIAFKLQYAPKGGATSCATVGSGNYSDVTGSTVIAYYDDSSYVSGANILDNPNDPSDGSRTMVPQTYQESNNFTNGASNIYAGQDGIWQFSLAIKNSTLKGNDFCLRVYSVTGSSILSAANVADVAYAPQMYQMMRTGKWFNRQGILQPHSL